MATTVKTVEDFIKAVRDYLRDEPRLNRLIEGVEHSDNLIFSAILDAINDYNMIPPPMPFMTGSRIPQQLWTLIKIGAIIHLLQSLTLLHVRNQLNYSDGGIHVGVFDKQGPIQLLIGLLKPDFDTKLKAYKISENLNSCFGGVHSEYFYISNFNDWIINMGGAGGL